MRADWYTKIIKVGNSFGVVLPIHILRLYQMDKQKQWVKIKMSPRGDSITIAKAKKPKTKYG